MSTKLSLLLMAAAGLAATANVSAQDEDGSMYVVTYLEAAPTDARRVLDVLAAHADATRHLDGNLEYVVLQRLGRPNHFATLERWDSAAAFERQSESAAAAALAETLAPLLYSPPDRRIQRALATGARRDPDPGAVYVLTHVDVFPPTVPDVVEGLRVLAEASRAEPSNRRFDVFVSDRTNHMTIAEVWQDAAAQDAHSAMPHNRAFRRLLAPAQGALYDERLYRAM